ncbi:selenocysteine-specific translation elongation factor [bacterium]|nr:selenocysteine-specific translation elongation factor [bacterium]
MTTQNSPQEKTAGHVIVGTAGHIDHGKSLLVKALTGTDPDRLPEEQERHITIDIGFAFLDDIAAIIDVPGHERFIRNMVAGAATIDYAILVIAADDGVMPQTQEHLDILRILGIKRGVVVITKAAIVEKEWLELVRDQIEEFVKNTFLENAQIFIVDSVKGLGISELRDFLRTELTNLQQRGDRGFFQLPIDRVFQMKGHGTVVTGTITSGKVAVDDRLELLPQAKEVRVRTLQTHGISQTTLSAGQRAAINLGGVDKQSLSRGNVLATPGHMITSNRWRAKVNLLQNIPLLKNRQRVRVHIGTLEVIARTVPRVSEPYLVDFYLEAPAVVARLDPFVLRSYSPMVTIGGGVVIEINPQSVLKKKRALDLEISTMLSQHQGKEFIHTYLDRRTPFGATLTNLVKVMGYGANRITHWLDELNRENKIVSLGERFLSLSSKERHCEQIKEVLRKFHSRNPELPGIERAELQQAALSGIPDNLFSQLMKLLQSEQAINVEASVISLPEHSAVLSKAHELLAERILDMIRKSAFRPPSVNEVEKALEISKTEIIKVLTLLTKQKRLVRLEPELFFCPDLFEEAIKKLQKEIANTEGVTVGNVATILDSTRKYIVPFLEYLDKMGITRRDGDKRFAGSRREGKTGNGD